MKRKAIICDIDGCLLDISKLEKDNNSVDYLLKFENLANNAEFVSKNNYIFELVNLYYSRGYVIIILTARSERIKESTFKYLTSGSIKLPKDILYFCRHENEEGIDDSVLKQQRLNNLTKLYNIGLAIDDKVENCQMFTSNGILSLQVRQYN